MAEGAAAAVVETAAVVEQLETAVVDATAAVEAAEDRAEAAQELSDQLADAALASEIGRRVGDCESEVAKWRSVLESQALLISELQTTLTMTLARVATLETAPAPILISTPQAPAAEVTPALAEVTAPAPAPMVISPESVVANAVPPRKKHRFL
jgi:Mg2+ and Co2+ transporter CorA